MDPEATLKWLVENINELLEAPDLSHRCAFGLEAKTCVDNLRDWINKGGFAPTGRLVVVQDGDIIIPKADADQLSCLPNGATNPYPNKIAPGTPDPRD